MLLLITVQFSYLDTVIAVCCLALEKCDDVVLPPTGFPTGASRPAVGFGSSINFEEAAVALLHHQIIQGCRVRIRNASNPLQLSE